MTDRTIRNGSIELATRDHGGDGPDLLLIPGAERTLLDFQALAPRLTESFHVVSMELRNHGASGDGRWTTDNVVSDVEAVIRELDLSTPAVVGHSLGGMVAAAHAARYPGSSSAAVNLDGIGLGRSDQYVGISPTSRRLKRFVLDGLTRLQQLSTKSFPIAKLDAVRERRLAEIRTWGHHDDAAAEEVWQRTVAPAGNGRMAIRPNGPQMHELCTALNQLDMFAEYRRVTCPVLILNCNDAWIDQLPGWVRPLMVALRRGIARDYAALVADRPNVTVHPMDARHNCMLFENTDELAELVTDFLLRVPERA
jgi:pimeloyl-ACP methyl ester carboxylesterase